jgi:uncharacterized membrane protein YeaQ/YmgE (transglycosylase-associated protein family)
MLPDIPSLLTWGLLGLLLGLLTSEFLTSRGHGQGWDTAIGIGGAFAGGLLVSGLGLSGQSGLFASAAGAATGALLLTALARVLPAHSPA